jgi:hypothetical protein
LFLGVFFANIFFYYRSLSAGFIPYPIRVNLSFITLSICGAVTCILARKLDPKDYETAHAREEVVLVEEEEVEN